MHVSRSFLFFFFGIYYIFGQKKVLVYYFARSLLLDNESLGFGLNFIITLPAKVFNKDTLTLSQQSVALKKKK